MKEHLQGKIRVYLDQYNHDLDLQARKVMHDLSIEEFAVLEEIFYSSIKTSLKTIASDLIQKESVVKEALEKFVPSKLIQLEGDIVLINQDIRALFEIEAARFEEDFRPGISFLKKHLKKVPIQNIPSWYGISRSSDDIFHSITEKYLLTPELFERHLKELTFESPVLMNILSIVYHSPTLSVNFEELTEKLHITQDELLEHLALLEFHLVLYLKYEAIDGEWQGIVTAPCEYIDWLDFLKTSYPQSIKDPQNIILDTLSPFSFIEDLSTTLRQLKAGAFSLPISIHPNSDTFQSDMAKKLQTLFPAERKLSPSYLAKMVSRLLSFGFVTENADNTYHLSDLGHEWMDLRLEKRAAFWLRHTNFWFEHLAKSPLKISERYMGDVERSIELVLDSDWVLLDDFFAGFITPLSEETSVKLERVGKKWQYVVPTLSPEQKGLIEEVIFDWLLEAGIVQTGTYNGKKCFTVTPFGRSTFRE